MCPLVMDCFMYYNLLSHPPFQYLYCPDSSSGRFFHLIPAPSLVFEPFLLVVLILFLLAFFSPFSFFSPPLHLSLPGTLCTSSLPALGGKQQPLGCSCTSELSSKPFCKFHTKGPRQCQSVWIDSWSNVRFPVGSAQPTQINGNLCRRLQVCCLEETSEAKVMCKD